MREPEHEETPGLAADALASSAAQTLAGPHARRIADARALVQAVAVAEDPLVEALSLRPFGQTP